MTRKVKAAATTARGTSRRPIEDPTVRSAIAARLVACRQAAGLSQQAVADQLDRPQSWLGKLETGRRSLLYSEAVALAAVYEVEVAVFATGGGSLPDGEVPATHG
jgi:transcriptional regulator with XRE-family HTH domain